MNVRLLGSRWTLPCAVALLSILWLLYALPRFHPAARLGLKYDRAGYTDLARQLASEHGIDAFSWPGYAKSETLAKNQELRFMMPDSKTVRMFPPAHVTVTLVPPGKSAVARVTLRPDGHPLGWKFPGSMPMKPMPPNSPDATMHELAGSDAGAYRISGSGGYAGEMVDSHWELDAQSSPSSLGTRKYPRVAIDTTAKNGAVIEADTVFSIPEAAAKKINGFPVFRTVATVLWFVILLGAIAIPVLREGSARTARAMSDRPVFRLSIIAALGIVVQSLAEWNDAVAGVSGASGVVTEVFGILVAAIVSGILFYGVLAGTVLNAGLNPSRVRGLRLLGTKAVLSRNVSKEALAGWLLAPLLIAAPLALSALFRVPAFQGYDDSPVLSRFPLIADVTSVFDQNLLSVLAMFGLLFPLATRLFRRPWVVATVATLLSTLTFLAYESIFREAVAANVFWALLQSAILLALYLRFGTLSGIAGYGLSRFLNAAFVQALQPAAALHNTGWAVMGFFGLLGLALFLISWRGPEAVAELYGESGIRLQARSRREELLAEFNVARSAQQQMLPARPPAIEGYTLAASCDPAREVGGDLYDFLRLKDGRWGIGVADVSGKGVPAALYMTLTKGLLSAAAQDSGDPHYILGVVNRHLRMVVKKKVFVTMALGVLDPASRTLQYARAGHNPVVWRRTAAGETHLLGGTGIGLGISGPALFAKTLKSQTLTLEPGDALIFYSDGLTEAMDEVQEQFGEERLIAATERTDGLDAGATRDSILREVKRFLKGGSSQDDLTIAVLRVNGVSEQGLKVVSD